MNLAPLPFARPYIRTEEEDAVLRVLRSGWLTTGTEALAFEQEFAAFLENGRGGSLPLAPKPTAFPLPPLRGAAPQRPAGGPKAPRTPHYLRKNRPPHTEGQMKTARGGPPDPPLVALAVNSSTNGLHLALEAIGAGKGDVVIVPSYTFAATAEIAFYLGAEVAFVDVAKDSFLMDPAKLEETVSRLASGKSAYINGGPAGRPAAIIPVHFAGLPCDMEAIMKIAQKFSLPVIEDAAHAFPAWCPIDNSRHINNNSALPYSENTSLTGCGVNNNRHENNNSSLPYSENTYPAGCTVGNNRHENNNSALPYSQNGSLTGCNVENNRQVENNSAQFAGTIGDIGVFSFYATKTITTGEGGMVVTRNQDLANRMSAMRLHGIDRPVWKRYTGERASWYYEVVAPGYKYNLPDLLAAIGRVQLKRALFLLEERRALASRYDGAFQDDGRFIIPPTSAGDARHLYPLRVNPEKCPLSRNALIEKLQDNGIGVSVHFIPLHTFPFYKKRYNLQEEDFPETMKSFSAEISLPLWPGMEDEQIKRVIKTIQNVC